MEMVLDTYEKAYDPTHPVLCMDEQPVQLIKETREPIPEEGSEPCRSCNRNCLLSPQTQMRVNVA